MRGTDEITEPTNPVEALLKENEDRADMLGYMAKFAQEIRLAAELLTPEEYTVISRHIITEVNIGLSDKPYIRTW